MRRHEGAGHAYNYMPARAWCCGRWICDAARRRAAVGHDQHQKSSAAAPKPIFTTGSCVSSPKPSCSWGAARIGRGDAGNGVWRGGRQLQLHASVLGSGAVSSCAAARARNALGGGALGACWRAPSTWSGGEALGARDRGKNCKKLGEWQQCCSKPIFTTGLRPQNLFSRPGIGPGPVPDCNSGGARL
jgi:hypothetical protein